MKRKIAAFLIGAAAVCVCALGFTACDLFATGGGHEHTIRRYEAKAASCKEEGHIEYWYCNSCGEFYSDENLENKIKYSDTVIDKTAHTPVTDPAVPKTCTTDGKTEGRHCSVCDTVIVAQQVLKASHTEIILPAVPKTCTTDGKTEGKRCTVCTQITVPQEMIPAGHTEVIDPAVPKTCTTDGKTEGKHCSVCRQVTVIQTTVPAGHTEVIDPRVEPGCEAAGRTEGKHCSECNTVLVRQNPIQATGHFEVIDEGREATCLTSGITAGKHCTQCNKITQAQTVIPEKGHTEVVDPAVAATCTSAGKTEGKHCSVCNTVTVAQRFTPMAGHSGSGKLCNSCGKLLVEATEGLTFRELTAMPSTYSARSGSVDITGPGSGGTLNIIGFEVTGGVDVRGELVIPESHNGLPVLGIGTEAFKSNTNIRSVTIPSGVKYIGYEAFAYCSIIRSVEIADSVEKIDFSAFRNLNGNLVSFKCPKSLNKILGKMLASNTGLRWVLIHDKVTEVDLAAFTYCSSLTDIYFEGTEQQWNEVVTSFIDGADPTINFYSATAPATSGNFWHYDANGDPVKW